MRRPGRTICCALLVALASCGRDERAPVVDLLDAFPFTAAGQTSALIDVGTPAADALLRAGWSPPTMLPDGASGAFAVARRAAVQFVIPRPHDGQLVLRCGLVAPGAPRSALLNVSLNGRRLGLVRVGPTLEEHTLPLPVRWQRAGTNVLDISNPLLTTLPRRADRNRARALAVDWIRLDGLSAVEHPTVERAANRPATLVIPRQSQVDFFVRLPRDAALEAEGKPNAPLRVTLQPDGDAGRAVADGVPASGRLRVPLAEAAGKVARLTLAATTGPVRLVAPVVTGIAPPRVAPPAAAATRPDVVLVVIDTLRADHLGCYGHRPPTSPHLDALAGEGVRFAHYRSQASWTLPATASIMTGLEPTMHGAVSLSTRIRPDVPTIAELLHAQGWETAGFVTNVNVRGEIGFGRGFDTYTYLPEDETTPTVHVPAGEVVAQASAWLDRPHDRPVFLYVHITDPHAPYRPPHDIAVLVQPVRPPPDIASEPDPLRTMIREPAARSLANLAWLESQYDGDVRVADEGLGTLVQKLRARGSYDRTLLVVTADHGEEFLEHGGFQHGHTLFDELLSVPLVVRLPGGRDAGRRVDGLARQIDVLPTILHEAGVAVPPSVHGRPLLGGADEGPAESFAHTSLGPVDLFGLFTDGWKVVRSTGPRRERVQVFDLARDPGEKRDVAAERPVIVGYAREAFARFATGGPRTASVGAGEIKLDRETAARLKALGYVAQ